ncbi:hypothetical protein DID88_008925 [Monilinia fructigena]|uniref:Uncharacterized protein n=1 Tax=Monilinia fructigena TaxID=38457 RepID=A0A395J6U5_9HELO|nr:hypothetical protein DID88_008925 [Monilinia fructigena]
MDSFYELGWLGKGLAEREIADRDGWMSPFILNSAEMDYGFWIMYLGSWLVDGMFQWMFVYSLEPIF